MRQPSVPAADPEMDDAMSVDGPATHQPAPARGTSTRGRGRGRWTRNKGTRVTKPAQQKPTAGRGRRHKVYDSAKLQAAHERTQELKQAFSAVVKFVKPAAQEVAERSVNELLENPAIHKQVPEYDECKKFLRERHRDAIKQCDETLQQGLAMTEKVWKAQREKVNEEFTVSAHSPAVEHALQTHPATAGLSADLSIPNRSSLPSCVTRDTASFSVRSTRSSTSTTTACRLM
jgi:hypothetical protein